MLAVEGDLKSLMLSVAFEPERASPQAIMAQLEEVGFHGDPIS